MTDSLTHLWNRRGWESMITAEEERCQTFGSPAGIVMVDLDNLKQINDACGHSAGDQLIILAARCIEQSVRATDKVARLGGDEFAILTVEVAAEVVPQMAERIETSLAQQGIAASVGWAVRRSQATLKEALERADQHMYEVKRIHKQQTMAQVGLLFCKILQEQNYRATE
jgi:diguanylate cyclase (GGDEF)-like protein